MPVFLQLSAGEGAVGFGGGGGALTLQLAGGGADYLGVPVTIDPTLGITLETGATTLTGAAVQITAGLLTGDALNFTDQNGISGAYNARSPACRTRARFNLRQTRP